MDGRNGADRIIETRGLGRTYRMGPVAVEALRDLDLTVRRGEMVAVMGPSGSGKSTLMNLIGCLDHPTAGTYLLEGEDVSALSRDRYADIRNRRIGFVFQGFQLLPRTSALENAALPLLYDRTGRIGDPDRAAREALERVGLGDRMDHEPNRLSGGQQQRVAIARALVTRPSILLADEPTGNLDTQTSLEVLALFQELNDAGITLLVVTHEPEIAVYAERIVELRDGRLVRDEPVRGRRRAERDLEETAFRTTATATAAGGAP